MRSALIASWVFFAAAFAAQSFAEDYVLRDANGLNITVQVQRQPNGTVKIAAHLDDDEIARIREACK